MGETDSLLVIGAGNAGAELAISARKNGWAGAITLFGDEGHLPYHRPPLSKAYLSGAADAPSLDIRPRAAYEKAMVALRLDQRVTAIDRGAREVVLADGERIGYTKLVLCLGGRARMLPIDGLPTDRLVSNLHTLRTQADANAIRANLKPGSRLVVIGGGYVGLEVAASARKLGADVTILEAQSRVLARVTGPEVSAFYEAVHRDAGVDLRIGVTIARVECDPLDASRVTVRSIVLADGQRIPADVLVMGVGGLPNVELAAAADLDIDNGIVVDEFGRTSDRHIYAAGDCTSHPSTLYGRRLRLESVPNALEQARSAAASLCGKSKAYDAVPWFWSDQYDLKLQMVGMSQGYDQFALRGSMASRCFTAFYLRQGRLLAADSVNRPADFMVARRLVAGGGLIDVAQLGDDDVPLKSLLPLSA